MFGRKSLRILPPAEKGWSAPLAIDPRFHELIAKLTIEASARPVAYRRRVILAACIGYIFIVAILALLAGTIAVAAVAVYFAHALAGFGLKIAVVVAMIAIGVVRAMAVAPSQPDGIAVTEAEAPSLFAMIATVRSVIAGPKVHAVYITDELNASMAQPSRVGVFGVRNILSIGLPMMQALTADELKSVIAHELGHSIGGHGRSASFVYRVRIRWMQLADRLSDGIIAGMLKRFFRWYGPWFNAYSFVLARAHEYEADRVAARLASSVVAGSALVRIELQAERFAGHWTRIWSESRTMTIPSTMPYLSAKDILADGADNDGAVLTGLLSRATDLDDTHPALADRLQALAVVPALPATMQTTAAETLLGPLAADLVGELDAQWWSSNADWWQACHAQAKADAEEHRALRATIATGGARQREHSRFIDLTAEIDGQQAAIDARRDALIAFPDAADFRYLLGTSLLLAGHDEGIGHIELAMRAWPDLATPGYRAIMTYLDASGRQSESVAYEPLIEQSEARDRLAIEETNTIDHQTELHPLQLKPADRVEIATALNAIPGLTWIVAGRRTLSLSPRGQTVFAFACYDSASASVVLDQIIDLLLDYGDVLGVEKTRANAWLVDRLDALEGSRLLAA